MFPSPSSVPSPSPPSFSLRSLFGQRRTEPRNNEKPLGNEKNPQENKPNGDNDNDNDHDHEKDASPSPSHNPHPSSSSPSHYKYPHLLLSFPPDWSPPSSSLSLKKYLSTSHRLPPPRVISTLHFDLLTQIILFFQNLSIIYYFSFDIWPKDFQLWFSFVLLFLGDISSFTREIGGDSLYSNSVSDPTVAFLLINSFVILLLPLLLILLYSLFHQNYFSFFLIRRGFYSSKFIQNFRFYVEVFFSFFSNILYLPVAIVLSKVLTCGNDSVSTLIKFDPSVECYSAEHFTLAIIVGILSLPYLIGVPIYKYYRVRRLLIFSSSESHERFLLSREFEYLIGVNQLFEAQSCVLVSPFARRFAYQNAWIYLQHGIMILIMTILDEYHTHHVISSSIVMLCFMAIPIIPKVFYAQFRIRSLNIQQNILYFTLILNNLFFVLSAGQWQSPFLVPSTLSFILLIINAVGIFCWISTRIFFLLMGEKVSLSDFHINLIFYSNGEVMEAINLAKELLGNATQTLPAEFFPMEKIVFCAKRLREEAEILRMRRDGHFNMEYVDKYYKTKSGGEGEANDFANTLKRRIRIDSKQNKHLDSYEKRMKREGNAKCLEILEWTMEDSMEDLENLLQKVKRRRNRGRETGTGTGTEGKSLSVHSHVSPSPSPLLLSRVMSLNVSSLHHSTDRLLLRPQKLNFIKKLFVLSAISGKETLEERGREKFQREREKDNEEEEEETQRR